MNKSKRDIPKHYKTKVSPWDLQKEMESSGNAFVDARRADAIKYVFRNKNDLLDDLKKAAHCIDEAIKCLEVEIQNPLSKYSHADNPKWVKERVEQAMKEFRDEENKKHNSVSDRQTGSEEISGTE